MIAFITMNRRVDVKQLITTRTAVQPTNTISRLQPSLHKPLNRQPQSINGNNLCAPMMHSHAQDKPMAFTQANGAMSFTDAIWVINLNSYALNKPMVDHFQFNTKFNLLIILF